jgi:uncharacterized protein YqfA (UPF0365 family)
VDVPVVFWVGAADAGGGVRARVLVGQEDQRVPGKEGRIQGLFKLVKLASCISLWFLRCHFLRRGDM